MQGRGGSGSGSGGWPPPCTTLIVDDDDARLEEHRRAISNNNLRLTVIITTAKNGTEAVKLLREGQCFGSIYINLGLADAVQAVREITEMGQDPLSLMGMIPRVVDDFEAMALAFIRAGGKNTIRLPMDDSQDKKDQMIGPLAKGWDNEVSY